MTFDFAAWAYDLSIQFPDPDFDLELHNDAALPFLVGTAADPSCPRQGFCAYTLEDYTRRVVGFGVAASMDAVRGAVDSARGRSLAGEWAVYMDRMLGYHDAPGPVHRAKAEQMARDMLVGSYRYANDRGARRPEYVTVRLATPETHWFATTDDAYPDLLYVNRRTGAFRRAKIRHLAAAEVATIR